MKDFFEGMFWVILIIGIIKFIVSYPAYLRKKTTMLSTRSTGNRTGITCPISVSMTMTGKSEILVYRGFY